eukprot:g644.t1
MATQEPLHRGMLWKKGHIRRNWKVRLFLLLPDRLQYFEQDGMVKKGEIPLAGMAVNIATTEELQRTGVRGAVPKGTVGPAKELRFELRAGEKQILLGAKDEATMGKWMNAFSALAQQGGLESFHTTFAGETPPSGAEAEAATEPVATAGDAGGSVIEAPEAPPAEASTDGGEGGGGEGAGGGEADGAADADASGEDEAMRKYSGPSKQAINKLTDLDRQVLKFVQRFKALEKEGKTLAMDSMELKQTRNNLAQLNGVTTGGLNSGKADAKAQRKQLTRQVLELHELIPAAVKMIDDRIAGKEPAAAAEGAE